MRIGLFGDIHANLPALDAVLTDMLSHEPDRIICQGDLAITGPQPREVIARVRALGCPVVRGNWDAWPVEIRDGRRSPDGYRAVDLWCAERFTAEDLAYLDSFPMTYELPLPDGTTLLCYHGSPRDYNELIDSTTPYEELDQILDGRRKGIAAGGHTHIAMLRRHGDGLVINPGSISENWNFSVWPERRLFNPHAEYALLDCDAAGVSVTFRRVPVDVDAVSRAALRSGMSDAEEWIATWLPGKAHAHS
jgi:predicted phosphodiesterase